MGSWMSEGRRRPSERTFFIACLQRRINSARSRFNMSSNSCGVAYRRTPLPPASKFILCVAYVLRGWVQRNFFAPCINLSRCREDPLYADLCRWFGGSRCGWAGASPAGPSFMAIVQRRLLLE